MKNYLQRFGPQIAKKPDMSCKIADNEHTINPKRKAMPCPKHNKSSSHSPRIDPVDTSEVKIICNIQKYELIYSLCAVGNDVVTCIQCICYMYLKKYFRPCKNHLQNAGNTQLLFRLQYSMILEFSHFVTNAV